MTRSTSVIMLTLNEEHRLPAAIENTQQWAKDIFIVDSLSSDRTVDIALEYGVHIVQRPFTNFGDQWNFALQCLPIQTPWTMKLDPDERLTDALIQEIQEVERQDGPHTGYAMDRRLWFMGKPLHNKNEVLRLWKTGTCTFSDVLVNEYPHVKGSVGKFKGLMEHLDSPDLNRWFEKQNRYTTMEAIMKVRGDKLAAEPKLFGNPLERRMFLKTIFYKLPLRYQLLWAFEFMRSKAFLDGAVGRAWTHLRVENLRNVEFKVQELHNLGTPPEMPARPQRQYDPRILETEIQQEVTRKDLARQSKTPSPFQT
ncbi:MAG: glycosyltransferase family 2 protein [Myxococcales bacterium]|nr:glycosyltransferase family 2 protein [Myxococcales bacterium]